MTIWSVFNTFIALLALCISAYNYYLQRKDKRPLLNIHSDLIIESLPLFTEMGQDVHVSVPVLQIFLSNPREKEVRPAKVFIKPKGKEPIEIKAYYGLPSPIEYGRRKDFVVHGQSIVDALDRQGITEYLHAIIEIQDELGNCHRSKRILLRLSDLEQNLQSFIESKSADVFMKTHKF